VEALNGHHNRTHTTPSSLQERSPDPCTARLPRACSSQRTTHIVPPPHAQTKTDNDRKRGGICKHQGTAGLAGNSRGGRGYLGAFRAEDPWMYSMQRSHAGLLVGTGPPASRQGQGPHCVRAHICELSTGQFFTLARRSPVAAPLGLHPLQPPLRGRHSSAALKAQLTRRLGRPTALTGMQASPRLSQAKANGRLA
jgi:hypothetical protein